jgi:hypothetical protein
MLGDKVPADIKSGIETKIADLRKVIPAQALKRPLILGQ